MTTDRLFFMWLDKLDRLGGLSPQEKHTLAAQHAAWGLVPKNDYVQKQARDNANDGRFKRVIGLRRAS